MTDPIAALPPAPVRRLVSTGLVYALALVFLILAATTSEATLSARLIMLGLGVAALWIATLALRTRHLGLILTDDALCDSGGTVLVPVDAIASVDRSAFAFKASNGFMLRLKSPASRAWVPGLYWRIGDRLSVGGATNPAETREMADRIAFLLADRS